MFYESRTHELLPVASALEAAQKIKNRDIAAYQVPAWTDNGIKYMAVNDAHIDDSSFAETAVIRETPDGGLEQIESITAACIDSAEKLADYFTKAGITPFPMGKAEIIFGKPTGKETAYFTCGCCGNGFKGNVKEQLEFDQDAGYGICKSCEKYYK